LSLQPSATGQRLVGGASFPAGGPQIAVQNFCAVPARLCGPVLAPPPTAFAGGTANDPGRQVIWDSDGPQITGVLATSSPPGG
jgi:hypothetical protein